MAVTDQPRPDHPVALEPRALVERWCQQSAANVVALRRARALERCGGPGAAALASVFERVVTRYAEMAAHAPPR